MKFFLHFHEFLTILNLPIFFFKISTDISVITDIFILVYEYVYFIIIVGLGLLIQPTGLKVLKPTCGSFFWLELMPICGNIKASCACCYYEIKIGGEGALFAFFLCHGAGWLISQFTGVSLRKNPRISPLYWWNKLMVFPTQRVHI